MKAVKISVTTFTEATNSVFVDEFRQTVEALLANTPTVFPNLPYTEAELNDRLAAITTKTDDAENGSRDQKNDRDLERSVCTYILFRLMEAVLTRAMQESTYEAAVAIVELAKFTPYKPAEPSGVIIPPTPKASVSNSVGTIPMKWKGNRHVKSWIVEHVSGTDTGPNAGWQYFATVGKCTFSATGLTTGYHSFRLRAISAVGQSAPSEAVTEYAR